MSTKVARSQPVARRRRRRAGRTLWGLLAVSALGIGLVSAIPYVSWRPDLSSIPLNPSAVWHFGALVGHAVPGILALVVGPFQFLPAIRRRSPALHRVLGRVYLVSVMIAAVMATVAALVSVSGFAAQVGFLVLAAGWVYSGLCAYRTARLRMFAEHRMWMIRNYALTFAAVVLRVGLGVGALYNSRNPDGAIAFDDLYTACVWGSILVSYLVAEWFIVGRTPPPATSDRPYAPSQPAP